MASSTAISPHGIPRPRTQDHGRPYAVDLLQVSAKLQFMMVTLRDLGVMALALPLGIAGAATNIKETFPGSALVGWVMRTMPGTAPKVVPTLAK